MREEQNIRVPQRLMHIPVAHELLICKPLIGLLFLMLGDNLTRDKLNGLCHGLRDYELVVPDLLLHVRDPLQRCDDEVSQHLAVAVCDFLIAVSLMRKVGNRSVVSFDLLTFFFGVLHMLVDVLYFRALIIFA